MEQIYRAIEDCISSKTVYTISYKTAKQIYNNILIKNEVMKWTREVIVAVNMSGEIF